MLPSETVRDISLFLLKKWESCRKDDSTWFGITDGALGISLNYAYRYLQYQHTEDLEKMFSILNQAIVSLSHATTPPSGTFGAGLSGLGWFMLHMNACGLMDEDDIKETLEQIDSVIEWQLPIFIEKRNHDFVRGANGIIFYMLKRGIHDHPSIKALINGYSGLSYRHLLKEQSVVDLSVPHGLCGVLLLLIKYEQKLPGIFTDTINDIASFLLSVLEDYLFQHHLVSKISNRELFPGRSGWCSGSISAGYALISAGKLLASSQIVAGGKSLLEGVIGEDPACVPGNTLCHGILSAAHLYNRIFLLTGEQKYQYRSFQFKKAAEKKFIEDFQAYTQEGKEAFFFESGSLLYGFSGVALSLLCMEDIVTPDWDECLLL